MATPRLLQRRVAGHRRRAPRPRLGEPHLLDLLHDALRRLHPLIVALLIVVFVAVLIVAVVILDVNSATPSPPRLRRRPPPRCSTARR